MKSTFYKITASLTLGSAMFAQTGAVPGQNPNQAPAPQPQAVQPCPPVRKLSFWEKLKEREKARLAQMAQGEIDKQSAKVSRDSHGAVDGTAVPTVQEAVGAATSKTCTPASAVPTQAKQ